MKVSLQWLRRYAELPDSTEVVEDALNTLGLTVEDRQDLVVPDIPLVVVGEVLSRQPHPNADRLSVCEVDTGSEHGRRQIVCGADNYGPGDRVPVALPGSVLPGGFAIKVSKLRGVESEGMMCSARELGLGKDAEGLLVLENRPVPGISLREALGAGDTVFDLEVTPNRPDCLSHLGVARELAAFFDLPLIYPGLRTSNRLVKEHGAAPLLEEVRVENEEQCPLYQAHVIRNVRVGPSPKWLRSSLEAVGLRPINNVVDVTNFVLMELGQPLHAFDAAKLAGGRIIVRTARPGESLLTLDGRERNLCERMLVIADAERPIAIAGVMGGANSEVDESTTDIILESAWFRPSSIRRTAKQLGLSSDSSYRYERGVDSQSLPFAAERALDLLLEVTGGQLCAPFYKVGSERAGQMEVDFPPAFLERICGFQIPGRESIRILESIGCRVRPDTNEAGPIWRVAIPSHRVDLERPIDLVEEILRIYGTDKIPPGVVLAPGLVQEDDPIVVFLRQASAYLQGRHLYECYNYTLRTGGEQMRWHTRSSVDELALANPISSDQTHLRHSLVPGLLDVLRLNQHHQTGIFSFFECGHTFREKDGSVEELISVAFVLQTHPESQWLPRPSPDFYLAKNMLENLAALAGISLDEADIVPVSTSNTAWQEGHSAAMEDPAGQWSARGGLMNLMRVRELDLQGEVYAGILTLSPDFLRRSRERPRFRPFTHYPSARRDLALVVPKDELAGTVRARLAKLAIGTTGPDFSLSRIHLFDVYEGSGMEPGQRSLAFALTYASEIRTLRDEEVNEAFSKLQESLRAHTNFTLRV